jgi:hypothetical protein
LHRARPVAACHYGQWIPFSYIRSHTRLLRCDDGFRVRDVAQGIHPQLRPGELATYSNSVPLIVTVSGPFVGASRNIIKSLWSPETQVVDSSTAKTKPFEHTVTRVRLLLNECARSHLIGLNGNAKLKQPC